MVQFKSPPDAPTGKGYREAEAKHDRKRRKPVQCTCGRFARYDAYYARWWCDRCDRRVIHPAERGRP